MEPFGTSTPLVLSSATSACRFWECTIFFVGKASAMDQPTRPTQPPTLSRTGNEYS